MLIPVTRGIFLQSYTSIKLIVFELQSEDARVTLRYWTVLEPPNKVRSKMLPSIQQIEKDPNSNPMTSKTDKRDNVRYSNDGE